MKVISLRCWNCATELQGMDKDLVLSCPGCGALWSVDEMGHKKVKGFRPSAVQAEPDLYLPYYLVRFRDNDFYLPAFRKENRTAVSDPSYRFSLKVHEYLDFEPFPHAAGTRIRFHSLENLAYAYAKHYFNRKIRKQVMVSLKPVMAMMPFVFQGEYLNDTVYGFRIRISSVMEADKIRSYYKQKNI